MIFTLDLTWLVCGSKPIGGHGQSTNPSQTITDYVFNQPSGYKRPTKYTIFPNLDLSSVGSCANYLNRCHSAKLD